MRTIPRLRGYAGRMLHCVAIATLVNFCLSLPTAKADPLLDEIVEFNGEILFLSANVPAVVIGAVRNGETSVRGFGQRAGPGSPPPDGDTLLRIGSVTKAFAGQVLAHMAVANKVQFGQPLTQLVPDLAPSADPNVRRSG